MIETVYKLRNGINTVNFADEDGPIGFTSATRAVLKFKGSTVTADTDIDPALIDYSQGSGDVVFSLGGLDIPEGEYAASLIIYDPSHTDGQAIVHADQNQLFFNFLDEI